jgi:hypothetical protein
MLEAQFLATISYYVSELRPAVKLDVLKQHAQKGELFGRVGTRGEERGASRDEDVDWTFVRRKCFEVDVAAECASGGNHVKALRVLREAEMEYGVKDGLYLNSALMIVEQMTGY